MSQIVTVLGSVLTLVRTAVGAMTNLWVFGVAVGFFVIGLAISFVGGLLNKRGGRRRRR